MRTVKTASGGALAERLGRELAGEAHFDASARALYATDASNYRIVPVGVVFPRSTDDIAATLSACAEHGVPVTARGGGTSTGGQAVGGGVVIDCSRHLDHVLEVDPERALARVEPGVVLDSLQRAAAPHGLAFGPDPSTHDRCTVGGMIGNNACGAHSLRYGKTDANVESLDVLLADGQRLTLGGTLRAGGEAARAGALQRDLEGLVARHGEALARAYAPLLPRRVSGYNLQHLLADGGPHLARALVGSEGTCALLLGATLGLVHPPAARALVVLAFPDVYAAAAFVPALLDPAALGAVPLTIEGIDERVVALSEAAGRRGSVELLGGGGAWLLVEVGGESAAGAAAEGERLLSSLGGAVRGRVVGPAPEQRAIWRIREDGAGLATRLPGGGEAFPGFEDAAVPPERLSEYLVGFDRLLAEHGRHGVHYGHYGEGCVHIRIDFDFRSTPGVAAFRSFMEDAADLVVAHGGSLSGEHGDGQARSELLARQYPPEVLEAFAAFKAAFDPANLLNPGLIVEPRPIDGDLRIKTSLPALSPRTRLALRADGGDLAAAARRCVGVGRCRRPVGGGMCPSYQVTREEAHSTRGRIRLLAEMLEGEVIRDGWRSREVEEALDLCLGCKACKSDCPVGVDMTTYKAEFLSRRYAWRLRPRTHYLLGGLPRWARLAARLPAAANLLVSSRRARPLRRLAGIEADAVLPRFAGRGERRTAVARAGGEGERVLLFGDTFTRHFDPAIARAAAEVLGATGFSAEPCPSAACCGLTWYSTGRFRAARRALRRTLRALAPALEAGLPVVVLEPSCLSMLAEDAAELFARPRDRRWRERAERLSGQVTSLAGLLAGRELPTGHLDEALFAQVHCHEQAAGGFAPTAALLAALGARVRSSTGCCGLAGNFGVEAGHGALSEQVARAGTLAQLAEGEEGELLLADGFSCRTQLSALAGRRGLHLAEVLHSALGLGAVGATLEPEHEARGR